MPNGGLRGRGAGGLPGPGSFQHAPGAREELPRSAANGVASSNPDVNRCTEAASSFSSKTLSRTREPVITSAVAPGLEGIPQRRPGHQSWACPVGGPEDTRRLGHPPLSLFSLCERLGLDTLSCRAARSAFGPQPSTRGAGPHPSRARLVSSRASSSRRRPARGVGLLGGRGRRPTGCGVARGQGCRGIPAPIISGRPACAMFECGALRSGRTSSR